MSDSRPSLPAPSPAWRDRLLALFRRRGWRGYPKLLHWLKPPGARRELLTVTRYGSRFYLRPRDGVDTHVLLEGFYESEVLEAVRPVLGPGAVLWVVGANFGLHAITAKFLHPHATVVAFEPSHGPSQLSNACGVVAVLPFERLPNIRNQLGGS